MKIALVGCGGVVRKYRKAYRALPGVAIAAAIDVNEDEAMAAAADTGAARASQLFDDALTPDIDAVVISTPNHLHKEQAVRALRAGKHVLLQKPMAPSVEECDEILAARRASGATLGVYMNLLDHPLVHDLRRMVQSGYFGKLALYSARLAHRGGLGWEGPERNWRASCAQTGGGSFIQLAVHYQHLMRWLTGAQVSCVQAVNANIACPHLEGDDLMLAHYRLSNGALGEIQTAWCTHEEHLSVMGTRASFHYRDNRRVEYIGHSGPFQGECLNLKGSGALEVVEDLLPPEWDDAANPHNQHRRFFEALAAGSPPEVTGEDGREDVRLVRACYESAKQGVSI